MSGAPATGADRAADRFDAARAVADATLYEGYVLYPYRASAAKNQVRWQFGVLVPPAAAISDPSERAANRTECLVAPRLDDGTAPLLSVRVRFLRVRRRVVEATTAAEPSVRAAGEAREPRAEGGSGGAGGGFVPVGRLEVGGEVHVDWDEALDEVVDLEPWPLFPLEGRALEHHFALAGNEEVELLAGAGGKTAGRVRRRTEPVAGAVRVRAEWASAADSFAADDASQLAGGIGPLVKVTVEVENTTPWEEHGTGRDEIVRRSLVAVHAMLGIDGGRFVSLVDPPAGAAGPARSCANVGTFPVLIGSDDVLLSSPIILYDHPEVAPESPGDLYDSTEIDEILALRVLTLTDEEKAEARGTDPRAAAVIDRCDDMPPEVWSRLHGAIRALGPAPRSWWDPGTDTEVDPGSDHVVVEGTAVSRGSTVILRPSRRADAHDLFLAGLRATVGGVFKDVDGDVHVAVTVDDDPATEELQWQGRYLYFHPEEIEPLPTPGSPVARGEDEPVGAEEARR